MADQEKFQALREEWSALVDQFLKTSEGQLVTFGLMDGEEEIFEYLLQDYADLLAASTNIEAQAYFKQQRHAAFEVAVNHLEEAGLKGIAERKLARLQCANLRNAATKVANKIRETRRAPEAKLVSEILLSDDVRKALDIASQPEFDVSCAFEDAPDSVDSKEAETRETRRAPDEEIKSLVAATVATPLIEPSSTLTVPVDSAGLEDIKSSSLKELYRTYSQAPCALDSNPPPVSISLHPASPPPAPDPGVSLGIESSIPPPMPEEADDKQEAFSPDDGDIEVSTDELTTEEAEADLNSFDELDPSPASKVTRRPL